MTTNAVARAGVQLFGVGTTTSALTSLVVSGFESPADGAA